MDESVWAWIAAERVRRIIRSGFLISYFSIITVKKNVGNLEMDFPYIYFLDHP